MMNDIVIKHNLSTDWATWTYLSGLAWFYFSLVNSNFKKEADKAQKKYDAKVGQAVRITSGFEMKDAHSKIMEIFEPLILELDKNGFKTTLTDKQLVQLKKKYSKS